MLTAESTEESGKLLKKEDCVQGVVQAGGGFVMHWRSFIYTMFNSFVEMIANLRQYCIELLE